MPVLVMAGELDMNSPTEVARSLRAFPNVTVVRVPFGPHALTSPASPMGDCVRGMLRTFLATKQVTDQKCTGETYRALGAFPQTVEDVPPYPTRGLSTTQRRVLAATFPTAADATARRNPDSTVYARVPNCQGCGAARSPSARTSCFTRCGSYATCRSADTSSCQRTATPPPHSTPRPADAPTR
ncbi:hypothetical protein AB0K67_37075 [Nonomuraea sp. NPDC052634]|uniref:alpha/beta fold hydrolase n=1 Tax=Nonomuraea sp. NPDC052634 TaxID=3155813 RepID=UPI003441A1D0